MNFSLSDLVPPLRWSDTASIPRLRDLAGLPDAWWRSLPMARVLATTGPEELAELLAETALERWPAAAVGDVLPALHVLDPDEADDPQTAIALDRAGSWPGLLALTGRELLDQPFIQARPVLIALFTAVFARLAPTAPAVLPGAVPREDVPGEVADREVAGREVAAREVAARGSVAREDAARADTADGAAESERAAPAAAEPTRDQAVQTPAGAQEAESPRATETTTGEVDPAESEPTGHAAEAVAEAVAEAEPVAGADAAEEPDEARQDAGEGEQAPHAAATPEQAPQGADKAGKARQIAEGPDAREAADRPEEAPEGAGAPEAAARGRVAAGDEPAGSPVPAPLSATAANAPDPDAVNGSHPIETANGPRPGMGSFPGGGANGLHPGPVNGGHGGAGNMSPFGPAGPMAGPMHLVERRGSRPERPGHHMHPGDAGPTGRARFGGEPPHPDPLRAGAFGRFQAFTPAAPESVGPRRGGSDVDLHALIERSFADLDDRTWAVAQNRVFTHAPSAIAELAKLFAVSPMVIEELEADLRVRLKKWLVSDEATPYRAHMAEMQRLLGKAAPKSRLIDAAEWHGRELRALDVPAWEFVLATLSGYRLVSDWVVDGDLAELHDRTRNLILSAERPTTVSRALELVSSLGIHPDVAKEWLENVPQLRIMGPSDRGADGHPDAGAAADLAEAPLPPNMPDLSLAPSEAPEHPGHPGHPGYAGPHDHPGYPDEPGPHDHPGHGHPGQGHLGHEHPGHGHLGHEHPGHGHLGHEHPGHGHLGQDHPGHDRAGGDHAELGLPGQEHPGRHDGTGRDEHAAEGDRPVGSPAGGEPDGTEEGADGHTASGGPDTGPDVEPGSEHVAEPGAAVPADSAEGQAPAGPDPASGKSFRPFKDVSQTRRCFRQPDGRWWLRVDIGEDHLKGGECPLPSGFAAYLGLSPGESRTVTSAAGEITLTWQSRPAVGSLGPLLDDVAAKEGSHLFLTLSEEGVLRARHLPAAGPGVEPITRALRLVGYTAPGGNVEQAARVIATRIGMAGPSALPDLLVRLRERGDRDLLSLLSAQSS